MVFADDVRRAVDRGFGIDMKEELRQPKELFTCSVNRYCGCEQHIDISTLIAITISVLMLPSGPLGKKSSCSSSGGYFSYRNIFDHALFDTVIYGMQKNLKKYYGRADCSRKGLSS